MSLVSQGLMQIVSGGQTGVDRGALDAALGASFPCGGWCPQGRFAEDGLIPDRYPLDEIPMASYAVRTRWNVRDSTGTLILTRGTPTGGTALTLKLAEDLKRPVLLIDLEQVSLMEAVEQIGGWLSDQGIQRLNVAGPRESTAPGIQRETHTILTELLRRLRQEERSYAQEAQLLTHRSPSTLGNSGGHSAATQSR